MRSWMRGMEGGGRRGGEGKKGGIGGGSWMRGDGGRRRGLNGLLQPSHRLNNLCCIVCTHYSSLQTSVGKYI